MPQYYCSDYTFQLIVSTHVACYKVYLEYFNILLIPFLLFISFVVPINSLDQMARV